MRLATQSHRGRRRPAALGTAPTEIIYQIATYFILGYEGVIGGGCDANFVVAGSAAPAKEGRLAEIVEEWFSGKLGSRCALPPTETERSK